MSLNSWEIPFRNDSGETIPPFSVIRCNGFDSVGDPKRYFIKAEKSDTYGSQWSHYLNGPVEVASGEWGSCTNAFPALATISGTPSVGDFIGPRNDEWSLQEETGGFLYLGSHSTGIAIVDRAPMLAFTGRFNSGCTQGFSGTVSVYWQGVDTGEDIEDVYAISSDFANTDDINASLLNQQWEAYCRTEPA